MKINFNNKQKEINREIEDFNQSCGYWNPEVVTIDDYSTHINLEKYEDFFSLESNRTKNYHNDNE